MFGLVKRYRTACLLALAAWTVGGAARAADVTVLCSAGLKSVVEQLAPEFEARTGDHLVVTYDTSVLLKAQVEAGRPFDVVVLTPPLIGALIQQGKVADGSAVPLARTGIGLAVKAGAPRPDIASVDALRRTLTGAGSVVYSTTGVSGSLFSAALQTLGIADAVKARARTITNGFTGDVVARGEADLAVQLMPELMSVPGVDVVGPFPAELKAYVVLTAGLSAAAADKAGAEAFLSFLKAPSAAAVIRAKGLEPI